MGEKNFSLLIVDDEKSNLDVLIHILSPEYNVQVAKSGSVALKRARENQPDLILLDILMPGQSGFEVLTELKEDDATRNIPVIFITGLASAKDEERGFKCGAVDYIVKPFNNSIVKARVRTHLRIIQQVRTIERLGRIDALTDIPDRRAFDQRFQLEWGRAVRDKSCLSLLIIDVDRFRAFNEAHGHPQGDLLLQRLASFLAGSLKRPADFAARVGGEEFAVLLPATGPDGAVLIGEEIRAAASAARVPGLERNTITSITVSIGVSSMIPQKDGRSEDLRERAGQALLMAKQSGGNRVCSERAASLIS